MTVVLLSPHLDDAVLSAFLTLARIPDDVLVVNVFDGVPDEGTLTLWDRICGATSSAELARERLAEDEAVLTSLGRERRSLGFRDALNRPRDDRLDQEEVTEALLGLVDDLDRPGILAPIGGGPRQHPDHRIVRDAARTLLGLDAIRSLHYYADFPYCAKAGAWPTVWGGTADVRWTGRLLRELGLGAWTDWTRFELDAAERAAKLDAMHGYRTQFGPLDRKLRTKGLVSNPELYGVEVLVSAPRPPAAG